MSIKRNFFYNMIYQVVQVITPLITIPYIVRVIGVEGVGINAYTNSIAQYFIILGSLGTVFYGQRGIAYCKDNNYERSKLFWEIFSLNIITVTMTISIYVLMVIIFFNKVYMSIFLVQGIFIFASSIDVSWFFQGIEEFKIIVIRNILIKVIGLILIFGIVNKPSDVLLYIGIISMSQLIGQILIWGNISKFIIKVKFRDLNIKKHIIPNIKLFIPNIATSVYLYIDKSMLGYYTTQYHVGIYDMAEKITKMPVALIASLGMVMMTRMSSCFAENNMDCIKNYSIKSFKFQSFISIAMAFGLIGCSEVFIGWFFGDSLRNMKTLIIIMSFILVTIGWGNVLGMQLLIPTKREKYYTFSITLGVVINLILNIVLIPRFYEVGAAVATLCSEISITIYQLYLTRDIFNIHESLPELHKYIVSGITMLIFNIFIGKYINLGFVTTIIQVIFGGGIYIFLIYILSSEFRKKLDEYINSLSISLTNITHK